MINRSSFFGGIANFIGGKQLILNDYLGGITLYYEILAYGDDRELHEANN